MLDGLLAALKGGDPFATVHGVSADEARDVLRQHWAGLDRLAGEPAAYRQHMEAMAREAGIELPAGFAAHAEATAAMKDKPPPPAAPAMVVRARILQAEGIVAPSVPKELALLLYPHTAGWLPPVLLACGRAVSAPARTGHDERGSGTALGGARDAADDFIRARRGSTSGRHGGSSDASSDCGSRGDRRGACQSSSSDTSQAEAAAEWRVAVIRFVEHAPAKVEPPSGGRPAVAVHHLECDAAALACAEQGQPEAARWIVAYAAVREFERLRGVKAEHNSTTVQVIPAAHAPALGTSQLSSCGAGTPASAKATSLLSALSGPVGTPANASMRAAPATGLPGSGGLRLAPGQLDRGLVPSSRSTILDSRKPTVGSSTAPRCAPSCSAKQRPLIQEVADCGATPERLGAPQVTLVRHRGAPCVRLALPCPSELTAGDLTVELHGDRRLVVSWAGAGVAGSDCGGCDGSGGDGPGRDSGGAGGLTVSSSCGAPAAQEVELPCSVKREGLSARLDKAGAQLIVRLAVA